MSEKRQYMLIFSPGPVQPFVQQARKTRDLWTGSLLFSKLMEAAMQDIDTHRLVFPLTRRGGSVPAIPNKYVALFDDSMSAREAAIQSQRRMADCWQQICQAVWQKMLAGFGDEETRQIWLRQTGVDPEGAEVALEAFFEISWAIAERQEGQSYHDWLGMTESRLAARKRLHDFRAREETGEKSSISGEREVLRLRDNGELQQFWKTLAAHASQADLDREGNERLDAIDMVKRFALESEAILSDERPVQQPFPSTSSIATASFVEHFLKAAGDLSSLPMKNWQDATAGVLTCKREEATCGIPYLVRLANDVKYTSRNWILQRDGDLYFAETFVYARLAQSYNMQNISSVESLAKRGTWSLRALLRATDVLGIARPVPYYAVIRMDGDNMGILLSGLESAEEHSKMSEALAGFARKTVVELVEDQYPARLVYAGGDDVLACAPLARDGAENGQPRHILDLVHRLQLGYCTQIRATLPALNSVQGAPAITASIGIVIAHHYTSLSYVLHSVHEAERVAKERYGRNALVVTLIRRSGEQTQVGCHWHYASLADAGQPIELFSAFYRLFSDNILSTQCVYTLLEEAPVLATLGTEPVPNAMHSEIKRLLKRQRHPAHKDAFSDEQADEYASHLARLAAAMDSDEYPSLAEGQPKSTELHTELRRYGLVEVAGWLLAMAFMARKGRE